MVDYIKVGLNTCGIAAGANEIYETLLEEVKNRNLQVEIKKTGCLGMCYAEPLIEVKIGDMPPVLYQKVTKEKAVKILNGAIANAVSENSKQKKVVIKNCGVIDPENIDDYIEYDGYKAIKKAYEMPPDEIISEVEKSGLRGRGGAGFPTWLKWKMAQENENEVKYIICNGDEGDPGAYMDRSILEGDPHSVIEGMMIAAHATGATNGVFYIRTEYPLAVERVQKAINQCKERGISGSFDMEIRLGAGAFVCGEETALIASIEGKRGYPKPRPPFPAQSGLWGKPTIINNVETLANIPRIILQGGENYEQTKVFALTGKIKKPSLVEIPLGMTIREILEDIGGGVADGVVFKAVQTGGPSGGIIPEEYFDTPVNYENLEALGSIMGSGGMIVMDERDCTVDMARFFMGFCVEESCGKCAPCRIGCTQMYKILEKITKGRGKKDDLDKLKQLAHAMQKASLCALGQTAPNPVLSSLRYFENEYLEHINNKQCPAGKCNMSHAKIEMRNL